MGKKKKRSAANGAATNAAPADMVGDVEDLARETLPEIRLYFRDANSQKGDRADKALKVLSSYSRLRATRANEMAIALAMAKMIGLKGEALTPLFRALTGADPETTEQRSAGDASGESA